MPKSPLVIFVCEHGAAKSVIAAAYFNKLAGERGLNVHAVARGTDPDAELSLQAVTGLRADGVSIVESSPQKLALADFESAQHIVAFCELPEEYQSKATVEQWDDVPPVSNDYEQARDIILQKIESLLER